MTHPFGTGTSQVFSLHGHVWQRNPYKNESKVIGDNNLSQWLGSRDNHGSSDHFDLVIDKAGGEGRKAGDYLYTVFQFLQVDQGAWGIFRVRGTGPLDPMKPTPAACQQPNARPGLTPVIKDKSLEPFIRQPLKEKAP